IAELVAVYLGSIAWQELSPGTRRLRYRLLDRFRSRNGDNPVSQLDKHEMARMLAEVKASTRGNWITALRGLFDYGVEIGLCSSNPTEGAKAHRHKSDGFHTWTEDEIATFEAHWQSGS